MAPGGGGTIITFTSATSLTEGHGNAIASPSHFLGAFRPTAAACRLRSHCECSLE
jgi:hypothetical protein